MSVTKRVADGATFEMSFPKQSNTKTAIFKCYTSDPEAPSLPDLGNPGGGADNGAGSGTNDGAGGAPGGGTDTKIQTSAMASTGNSLALLALALLACFINMLSSESLSSIIVFC